MSEARALAMKAHYERSLTDEREAELWDSGKYYVEENENPYQFRTYRFGNKSLIERARNCPEFIDLIKINANVCRDCGADSVGEIYGFLYCQKCLDELAAAWNTARKSCGLD